MRDQTGTCRSCGAPILWTKTRKGKNMPLDPKPDPEGRFVQILQDDHILAHFDRTRSERGPHYQSHFATCPDADQHRRS